jgi:FG-GAP repeat protein
MGCGIAHRTCWSGSRRLRLSWSGRFDRAGLEERKGAGRLWRIPGLSVLISAALVFSSQLALAQFSEQKKLVGTEAIGNANQGSSVSLSSDGNTAIVGGYRDDGNKGAAWVYVNKNLQQPPWRVAIDPMALILKGKALDIWFEMHHPNEPSVAQIQQVLRSMTPEEQKEALNRARTLKNNAKAEQKMLRFMTPAQQKAALNRARTLENYAKAVEEAFATMKK